MQRKTVIACRCARATARPFASGSGQQGYAHLDAKTIIERRYNGPTGDNMPKKPAEPKSDPFKGLPPQIAKNLKRSGINNLEEAQKLSDEELAGIKNIGPDVARKIRNWKS